EDGHSSLCHLAIDVSRGGGASVESKLTVIVIRALPSGHCCDQIAASQPSSSGETTVEGAVFAAVLREAGGPVRVEEIDLPAPGPGQVRVRLAATGVCHSDLSLARGTLAHDLPVALGHEGAGTVVSVGDGVRLHDGDPVVFNWSPACGACWFCARGE